MTTRDNPSSSCNPDRTSSPQVHPTAGRQGPGPLHWQADSQQQLRQTIAGMLPSSASHSDLNQNHSLNLSLPLQMQLQQALLAMAQQNVNHVDAHHQRQHQQQRQPPQTDAIQSFVGSLVSALTGSSSSEINSQTIANAAPAAMGSNPTTTDYSNSNTPPMLHLLEQMGLQRLRAVLNSQPNQANQVQPVDSTSNQFSMASLLAQVAASATATATASIAGGIPSSQQPPQVERDLRNPAQRTSGQQHDSGTAAIRALATTQPLLLGEKKPSNKHPPRNRKVKDMIRVGHLPTTFPCKCRGMPPDHTPQVSFCMDIWTYIVIDFGGRNSYEADIRNKFCAISMKWLLCRPFCPTHDCTHFSFPLHLLFYYYIYSFIYLDVCLDCFYRHSTKCYPWSRSQMFSSCLSTTGRSISLLCRLSNAGCQAKLFDTSQSCTVRISYRGLLIDK